MLREAFRSCAVIAKEAFANYGHKETFANVELRNRNMMTAVFTLVFVVLILLLILLFGKFLWNNVACKYITIIKPVPSVVELLAIIILLDLVLPNNINLMV
jgi:hypothetical protein